MVLQDTTARYFDSIASRCVSENDVVYHGTGEQLESESRRKRCASQPMTAISFSLPPIKAHYGESDLNPEQELRTSIATKPFDDISMPSLDFSSSLPSKPAAVRLEKLSSDAGTLRSGSDRYTLRTNQQRPYIPLRQFVHSASHALHVFSADVRGWCEHLRSPQKSSSGSSRAWGSSDVEQGLPQPSSSPVIPLPSIFLDGAVDIQEPAKPDRPDRPDATKPKKPRRTYRIFPDEPSFGQWAAIAWRDFVSLSTIAIISLLMYTIVPPLHGRPFPFRNANGSLVDPSLAYPKQREYINTTWSAITALLIPLAFILAMSLFRIGSFWDMHNAVLGLLYALATATVFQVFIKTFLGGFRPHFLAVCRPMIPGPEFAVRNSYGGIYYSTRYCTGPKRAVEDAMLSFPSGHAVAAWAGFFYLALYINAKFKVFADYHSNHWKLVLFALPLLLATILSASKVMDHWHHPIDIFVGSMIGKTFALMAWRQMYQSAWDWRTNHIPTRNRMQAPPEAETKPTRYYTAINTHDWHTNWSYFQPMKNRVDKLEKTERAEREAAQKAAHEHDRNDPIHFDGPHDEPIGLRGGGRDIQLRHLKLRSMGSSLHVPSRRESREYGVPPHTHTHTHSHHGPNCCSGTPAPAQTPPYNNACSSASGTINFSRRLPSGSMALVNEARSSA